MLRGVDIAPMLQHFLLIISVPYYERSIVTYPEILDGISMRRVGGPDEMIVVDVCSLR